MRWLAAVGALLLCSSASAADWSINNRIQPGENRTYEFTTLDDSSMLDARACATTIFSWDQDITGSQTTGEATLYSCPKQDSVVANCFNVTSLSENETGMSVPHKPGFFMVQADTAPTSSAVSRMTAFCSRKFVPKPNFIARRLLHANATIPPGQLVLPFVPGGYTRGYLVSKVTASGGDAHFTVVNNNLFGPVSPFLNAICLSNVTTGDEDAVTVFGGERYVATTGTAPEIDAGVDKVCNLPLSRDLQIGISTFGTGADVELWFYGVPN